MGKIKNNQQGFGIAETIIVAAVIVLIGVAGWLVYKDHSTTTSNEKTNVALTNSNAAQLMKDFYDQYIAIEKTPPTTPLSKLNQLIKEDGTSNLENYINPNLPSGYVYYENPVLCTSGTAPESNNVKVSDVTLTRNSASGVVTELFGGNDTTKINVSVVKQSGSLKINSITCTPKVTAQPSQKP